MNEVNVGSFTNLDNAVTLTNAFSTQVVSARDFAKKVQTQLSDDRIFQDQVEETCTQLLAQVNTTMDTLSDNFKKLASYITKVTENYKAADINAGKTVSGTK